MPGAWCVVCGVCNVGNVHLGVNYEMQRATDSVYVIAWESFLLHHGKKKGGRGRRHTQHHNHNHNHNRTYNIGSSLPPMQLIDL